MTPSHAVAEACHKVGAHIPHWTQGAGGNLSRKEKGILYIKASGSRLDGVTAEKGVARVATRDLVDRLARCRSEEDYSAALADCRLPDSPRPSMEAGFHALLPRAWVLHFHSLAALLMCHERGSQRAKFDQWARGRMPIKVLPAILPGLELSRAFSPSDEARAFLLENHGVVLHADSLNVLEEWAAFEKAFLEEWKYGPIAAQGHEIAPCPLRLYFPDSAVFLERMKALQATETTLVKDCWKKDRDVSEIWQATSLLYRAQKDLAELPVEISSKVSGLPTEQFRKRKA